MGRPFPCLCSCSECSDFSLPWYYRCCEWIAGPPAFKAVLDGTVFNFGTITPASTTDPWSVGDPNSTTSITTSRKYGQSILPITFDQSFTVNCDALINSPTAVATTGTLTYRLYDVRLCLGVIYTTAAGLACKRSYRLTVAFNLEMTDFTLSDFGIDTTFHAVESQFYTPREVYTADNAVNFGSPITFGGLQYFSPRTGNCDAISNEFVPEPIEDDTKSGNAFAYHPTWTAASGPNFYRLRIQSSGAYVNWSTVAGTIPLYQVIPHVTYLPIPYLSGNCLFKRQSSVFDACETGIIAVEGAVGEP